MRNRQLIARWVFEKGAADKVVEMVKKDGKTYVVINDYQKVRELFGELLAEIQRIKSTGDFEGARALVENYAVKVDPVLHAEVLERYKKLNLAPYKGFINPVYELVTDKDGNITDVTVSYNEDYVEQMLRYSIISRLLRVAGSLVNRVPSLPSQPYSPRCSGTGLSSGATQTLIKWP